MSSIQPLRVVLFTCGPVGFASAEELCTRAGVERVTVVLAPYRTPQLHGLEKVRHVVKYDGILGLVKGAASRAGRVLRANESNDSTVSESCTFDVLTVDDFHSPVCIDAVRGLNADLGVIVGTHILKPSIFEIPRLGSINLHTGKAPEYRGSAPAFWEMYNGETRVGITIHRVAAKVDAGDILRQESFPFDPAPAGDPVAYIESYRETVLTPNGIRLLADTVDEIAAGTALELPQDDSTARTYRMPDRRQVVEMKRRVARRRRSGPYREIKRFFGWAVFRSGFYRRMLSDKAIIVLFHRVDDDYAGNPISCTTDEFDRYCRFFAEYFDVISAAELTSLLRNGKDVSGKMVITFDDGYADNVAAAAVLKEYGLPACFFIATGFIGTERDGWWDIEQGCRSRWMTWDDVKQLDEWGFELGAHTENHIDLGRINGSVAAGEIQGSKKALEEAVGKPIVHFSYPYGGRHHISAENLDVIRTSGFDTCMSAYGGVITKKSDFFDLQRIAVTPWHRSHWQLGVELLREPAIKSLHFPGE